MNKSETTSIKKNSVDRRSKKIKEIHIMDGYYLGNNLGPLKTVADGKVFIKINDLMNTRRFKNVELAAYSISGRNNTIVTCEFLFRRIDLREILYFRAFDFYKSTENISDDLRLTADHGIGFADVDMERFVRLRDFYLNNKQNRQL